MLVKLFKPAFSRNKAFIQLISLLIIGFFISSAQANDTHTIVDVVGRSVEVPTNVERLLLGEGRYVPTLAMFNHKDPIGQVVGVFGEFERVDPASYQVFVEQYPALADVPRIGRSSEDTFSVEQAIALTPQVALFGLEGHGPTPNSIETLNRLAAAGIAVIFIDFRLDPLVNTPRSIDVLGQLFNQPDVAAEFIDYYQTQLKRVTDVVAELEDRPSVFLESRVGLMEECCHTIAKGLFANYIEAAGGNNIAVGKVPGEYGVLSMEYLLEVQPDVYIGTAIGAVSTARKMPNRIVLGVGAQQDIARSSLRYALKRPGFAGLAAVEQERVHAIWHHFYNSPFNVAAVQVIAKWLHPEAFADLDPEETLATLYKRFQPIPLNGEYWISLHD